MPIRIGRNPIWGPIVDSKPELFLLIGDAIYADTEDIQEMRGLYTRMAELPGFKKLRASCPLLGTWDDHDYGGNDVGEEYPKKKESQQAFLDFLQVPKDSPRRKQEGVYDAVVFGPPGKRVQVILLDTRYHRSPLKLDRKRPRNQGQYVANNDSNATILGETQWKWLGEQLKVPAELRLLVSSIQVVAEDHGFEKWMNFPLQRERLYQLLRETRASGVVILSGDRHLAELSVMDAGLGYPLLDLTSSGINQASKRWRPLEMNRHRVATMNQGDNFGMVGIDWNQVDPLVRLEIHDVEGDVIIRHKVPLSRLQADKSDKKAGGGKDLAAEAMKQVGKEWTVELTVRATGQTAQQDARVPQLREGLQERTQFDDRTRSQETGRGSEKGENHCSRHALRRQEDPRHGKGVALQREASDRCRETGADQAGEVRPKEALAMNAVVCDRWGDPEEVLNVRDVPPPKCGPGQVRVRHARQPHQSFGPVHGSRRLRQTASLALHARIRGGRRRRGRTWAARLAGQGPARGRAEQCQRQLGRAGRHPGPTGRSCARGPVR